MDLEKEIYFARKIIEADRNQLVMEYRFLVRAIYALTPKSVRESDHKNLTFATDGTCFYYREKKLIDLFRMTERGTTDTLLHSILHCLYLHPFFTEQYVERKVWDIACDICVWDVVNGIKGREDLRRKEWFDRLRRNVKVLSAQGIYRCLREERDRGHLSDSDMMHLWNLFHVDDHDPWYLPKDDGRKGNGGQQGMTYYDRLVRRWRDIVGHAEMGQAMEAAKSGKQKGDFPGWDRIPLDRIEREHIDYSSFLRRFAAVEERMHIDMDAFDYSYYVYGLELYKDMPLIEPLEYKEIHSIRDFVIAIDTSGSCDIDLVRRFLAKTYDILSASVFKDNDQQIHIMQCDAIVQNDTTVHHIEELREYMQDLKIYGRGGTDFRPVFQRVEELRQDGKLRDLKGLLYFTDGYGTFPEKPTDYRTAFVFAEMDENIDVPAWAMSVYIEEGFDQE